MLLILFYQQGLNITNKSIKFEILTCCLFMLKLFNTTYIVFRRLNSGLWLSSSKYICRISIENINLGWCLFLTLNIFWKCQLFRIFINQYLYRIFFDVNYVEYIDCIQQLRLLCSLYGEGGDRLAILFPIKKCHIG